MYPSVSNELDKEHKEEANRLSPMHVYTTFYTVYLHLCTQLFSKLYKQLL